MERVFIIAEAGVNHNGSIEIAKQLVDGAVRAGVDAIKFQTFKAEHLVTKSASKANYQKETTGQDETQFEMLKKLELSKEMHIELMKYCEHKHIQFISAPFDMESIETLDELGIEIFKIPSGEITNLPYLRKIGSLKKQVILSTGMSHLDEVRDAIQVLRKEGTNDIVVLHCNTQYPTPMQDVNLKAMQTIQKELNIKVGYSDHTLGIEVPIAAVAMGACVIEKHFTIDKNMPGPDHKASLDCDELVEMVRSIRNIEQALGSGNKHITESESKNIEVARKSIVAATTIHKGEVYTEENLTTKRPGTGISPMKWDEIIGKVANQDYKKDELITW